MSDLAIAAVVKVTRRKRERPSIRLANGVVLRPRIQWAEEKGLSDKTAARLNLPTTYIGNVAYVADAGADQVLADRVCRRNEPKRRVAKT